MKLVVQVKLLPDTTTEAALRETLKLCNQAACHASRRAHATGAKGKTTLQRLVYGELKAMGLSAQPAIHCVRKVAGAYATLDRNVKAGNYTVHSGKHINQVRHRNRRLRTKLQRKGTRSAKRLLRHLSGREARFAADTNHRISKQIVTEAQRTTRGIALEDLGGIRARVRLRKPQRVTLHSWSFAQLGAFIAYKARRAGVPVVFVDPRYTSQGCSACGHIHKRNRPDPATFNCTSCGFAEHADVNAARNIAARGAAGWAVSHAADDAA
ncbi:IS605 family transposase OrfB [Mycobacterium tuberculosis]|nr:IS605 family transposase OrfB [Mycobacterium tuberculosis]